MAVLPLVPSLLGALLVVLTVGLLVPPPRTVPVADLTTGSWTSGRAAPWVGLSALAALAAVARFGPPSELDNPAPAVAVGLAPLLLATLPALVGLVLRRRHAAPPLAADPRLGAWVAVPGLLLVAVYLSTVPERSRPALLGAVLGVYAVVGLAVAVALGRGALARVEPVGLLAAWIALGPRLVRWQPPAGAWSLLAVVLGAAWSERWSRTESWADTIRDRADLGILLAASVAGAVALAGLLHRWSGPVAAAAMVPLAAGAVLAGGLRRGLISGQLLLQQAGLRDRVEPDLLGFAGGQGVALGVVVVAGCLSAAVVARRSGDGPARLPALAAVLAGCGVSAYVVLQP